MASIVEEDYGNYRIKAGKLGGAFVARAFPKPPVKTQGTIAEASGKSQDEAIAALKESIDSRASQRSADRRLEDRAGIPVPQEEEFTEALLQSTLSDAQVAMLKAHALSETDGMTAAEMARAAGYKSRDVADKVFRKAGALIAGYLGIDVAAGDDPHGDGPARILAYRNPEDETAGGPTWIMHEELRKAVRTAL